MIATDSRTVFLRLILVLVGLLLVFISFALAGPRSALLVCIGLGFGLVLEGLRFGFTGPWKRIVRERDGRGLMAQLFSVGLCAVVAFPLLAAAPQELAGAHAPVGVAMILGAFVFGATMQLVLGCGSGTLVNAGSGNMMAVVALLGFIAGSFFGTLHLDWWTGLGSLPVYSLQGLVGNVAGLWLTLFGLALVSAMVLWHAAPGKRLPSHRLWLASALVAALAILNLIVAGQPWGVVYGLGLWGAKVGEAVGFDVAATTFWSTPMHAERLRQSLFTDVTSLTNIGIIVGAFMAMRWRRQPDPQAVVHGALGPLAFLIAGIVLGYSARMAFGCNVGAYFSGIATGSLHGWVWFAAAFAGSTIALNLQPGVLRRLHPGRTDLPGTGVQA